jgi:hypothetical protein
VAFILLRLRGTELSPGVEFFYEAAFICGVGWWLQGEIRKYGLKPLYCRGLLIPRGWPIVIIYYQLKSHGFRGVIPLVILLSAFILAQIIAVLIYTLSLT